jgi:hypothetical protein
MKAPPRIIDNNADLLFTNIIVFIGISGASMETQDESFCFELRPIRSDKKYDPPDTRAQLFHGIRQGFP